MENLGLNQFLQPVNSPVAQNQGAQSAYDFYSTTESNSLYTTIIQDQSVTNAKIVNITADKIQAGTVTVGLNLGTASGGNSYLKLDGGNTQILVNDGTNDIILMGKLVGGF